MFAQAKVYVFEKNRMFLYQNASLASPFMLYCATILLVEIQNVPECLE